MRALLSIIATILLVLIVLGALVIWGPLGVYVPWLRDAGQDVTKTVTDPFRVDRPGIDTGVGGQLPGGGEQTGEQTPLPPVWTLPSFSTTTVVHVKPFLESSIKLGSTTSSVVFSSTTPQEHDIKDLPTEGTYILNPDAGASTTPQHPYVLIYNGAEQSFTIGLTAEPLGEVRLEAEKALLQMLGLEEKDACSLRHSVVTLDWVNSFYSNKNLGFSFCPGATKL